MRIIALPTSSFNNFLMAMKATLDDSNSYEVIYLKNYPNFDNNLWPKNTKIRYVSCDYLEVNLYEKFKLNYNSSFNFFHKINKYQKINFFFQKNKTELINKINLNTREEVELWVSNTTNHVHFINKFKKFQFRYFDHGIGEELIRKKRRQNKIKTLIIKMYNSLLLHITGFCEEISRTINVTSIENILQKSIIKSDYIEYLEMKDIKKILDPKSKKYDLNLDDQDMNLFWLVNIPEELDNFYLKIFQTHVLKKIIHLLINEYLQINLYLQFREITHDRKRIEDIYKNFTEVLNMNDIIKEKRVKIHILPFESNNWCMAEFYIMFNNFDYVMGQNCSALFWNWENVNETDFINVKHAESEIYKIFKIEYSKFNKTRNEIERHLDDLPFSV